MGDGLINAHMETEFLLNIFDNGNQTYIHHKDFKLNTDINFNEETGVLQIKPSSITMEHGDFELDGSLETKNNMNIDLKVKGTKPNFDVFIAFAPDDLIPVLERYKNQGNIYFNGVVQGHSRMERCLLLRLNLVPAKPFSKTPRSESASTKWGLMGISPTGKIVV